MRTRCTWIALVLLLLLCPSGMICGVDSLQAAEVANLQEELTNGLKATRPNETAFIAKVVRLVQKKRLPLAMVKSTFQWARKKQPAPYPYFEQGMRRRAARIGVRI